MPTLDARYRINGLVDTSQTALENMTAITNSCNTWLSYDAMDGKWSVIINRAGNSEISFGDANIIGSINMTTTDLSSYYNSVEVRFHNFSLRDREDYVLLEIPSNQRYPNEPDNKLTINAPMVNNQIQAELIGLIELKQSRLDLVIEFTTDYSYVNVQAGTIISVTNSVYGWTNKLFRVLQMTEGEFEDTITITFKAQEYDVDVYDDTDLFEYLRDSEDGLIELDPLVDVSAVTDSTAVVDPSTGQISPLLFALPLLLSLLDGLNDAQPNALFNGIFNAFENDTGKDLINAEVFFSFTSTLSGASVATKLDAMSATSRPYFIYDPANQNPLANRLVFEFTIPDGYTTAEFEIQSPTCNMDYYALDQDAEIILFSIFAQPAFSITVRKGATLAGSALVTESTVDWTSNYTKLVVNNPTGDTYYVTMRIIPTYDLNMNWPTRDGYAEASPNFIYFSEFSSVGSATCTTTVKIQ